MKSILEEINLENGSNYKLAVLEKYKDNAMLKRVLAMTYDSVKYTYGITLKNINYTPESVRPISLVTALWILESKFCTREVTGNAAISLLTEVLGSLSTDNAQIVEKIISRDLKINVGRTNINKVFKGLITKPAYMRCSLFDKIDRIKFPAVIDKKEDGTYRSIIIESGKVTTVSRSGEVDNFVKFAQKINISDGVYIGEFLVRSLPGKKNRMKANGLINSLIEPDDLYFSAWDYLTLTEFATGSSSVPYSQRRETLINNIGEKTEAIEFVLSKIVNSLGEAQEFYNLMISSGFEGAVLKNLDTPFKDGTSFTQIKLKEEAVAEFFITGYQEGLGRFQGTLGAMFYESSDSLVKGKMGGFNDEDRDFIWKNRDELLNSIVSVKYNGITKAKGKEAHALMFANFVELRPEKSEADDLEYIQNALK